MLKIEKKLRAKKKRKDAPHPILHIVTYDPRIFRNGTCQEGKRITPKVRYSWEGENKEAELTTELEVEQC